MTDFGANIFDDQTAAPAPPPARTQEPPAAPAPILAESPRSRPSRTSPAGEAAAPTPPVAAEPEAAPPPARHHRHTRFERADRNEPPTAGRSRTPRRPAAPADASTPVALLVDLEALHREARAQRHEVALHRLARALGGGRPIAAAIAFTASDRTPPAGFQLQPGSEAANFDARFATAAEQLAQAHGTLLLAPATAVAQQLAARLRRAGHTIELASLEPSLASSTVRQLGRDCLFAP